MTDSPGNNDHLAEAALTARRQYDPERRRRYYEANREKIRDRQRRYYAANAERAREKRRVYREANREKVRETWRRYREANPEKVRESQRRWREGGNRQLRSRHGLDPSEFADLWRDQAGCCYLCGEHLDQATVVIDHDHSCCPPNRSCAFCRRGLACLRCNLLIGQADDNPELLRRVASRLEAVMPAVAARIALKPAQDTLWNAP